MFFQNVIESFLECSAVSHTKHITESPISLSCGHAICHKCIENQNSLQIYCSKCDKLVYNTNEESIAVKNMLKVSIKELYPYLRDKHEYYLEQMKINEEAINLKEEYLQDEIDIRIESLKSELDKLREKIYEDILTMKKNYNRVKSNEKEMNVKIKQYESNLQEVKKTIKSQSGSLDKYYELQNSLIKLNISSTLHSNEKFEIKFVPSGFQLTKEIIGRLEETSRAESFSNIVTTQKNLVKSLILSPEDIKDLIKLCNLNQKSDWFLLYRGSTHGWKSSDFHQRCDGEQRTLTVIKSNNNSIFGGFTNVHWTSEEVFKCDPSAFVFSFKNPLNVKFKAKVKNSECAIFCHPHYGPTFGGQVEVIINYAQKLEREFRNRELKQADLCVTNKPQTNKNTSYFPSKYSAENLQLNGLVGLCGSQNFQIMEIEVFRIYG